MTIDIKHLNIRECKEILQKLKDENFTIIRIQDWEQYKTKKDCGKIMLLRHDLDISLDLALELGALEHSMGIHATYFVLHTAVYYHEPNFIAKCLQLQNMGHEIGLHYNIINVCRANPHLTPKIVLDKEIEYLRSNGIKIYGLAAHSGCHPVPIVSYHIFKEFKEIGIPKWLTNIPTKCDNVDLFTLSFVDYGLYESYYIHLDPSQNPQIEYFSDCYGKGTLIEKIDIALRKVPQPLVYQMLLHPCNHTLSSNYRPDDKNQRPHP